MEQKYVGLLHCSFADVQNMTYYTKKKQSFIEMLISIYSCDIKD